MDPSNKAKLARRRIWLLLWLATSGVFGFVLEWRLRNTPWYANFFAAGVIGWLLTELFARKHVKLQVFLQWRRRTTNTIALLALSACLAAICVSLGRVPSLDELLTPDMYGWLGAGFALGMQLRRHTAQAASPGFTESRSLRPRAILHCWLALVAFIVPGLGTVNCFAFIASLMTGASTYWLRREADYLLVERSRRKFELATLPEDLSEEEVLACRELRQRRYRRALKLVRGSTSAAAQMIKAIVAYERRRLNDAARYLDKAEETVGLTDKRRAKVKILKALVLHDMGDAPGVSEALREALRLDSTCQLATVGLQTMGEHAASSRQEAEKELLSLLETVRRARAPLRLIGDQVISVVWRVDHSFFRSALGLKLLQMGHPNYAEEILERVVQLAPGCASARLHQAMVFAAYCRAATSPYDRTEFADSARISFKLAAKLAPPESVTARRAMESLDDLERFLSSAADDDQPRAAA